MTSLDILNTLFVKNNKEAFDLVHQHLVSQGEKSFIYGTDCAYRGKEDEDQSDVDNEDKEDFIWWYNGKSCAVGCLIKNDYYDENIELTPASSDHILDILRDSHPEWEIDSDSVIMLEVLQKIHDGIFAYNWEIALTIARKLFFEDDIIVRARTDEYELLFDPNYHVKDIPTFIWNEIKSKATALTNWKV